MQITHVLNIVTDYVVYNDKVNIVITLYTVHCK